eukprot:jgi/Galph1/678/GphlegSOOS_G5384.1
MSPVGGIRILYYPDRIVVQDISSYISPKTDPSDSNAIIEASNKVSQRLVNDNVRAQDTKFLELSFDGIPTETTKEPTVRPIGEEAAVGFLGVLYLFSGPFAVFALQVKRVGELPGSVPIYAIDKVRFAKLFVGSDTKADRELGASQTKLLESGHVYFCIDIDLTKRLQSQYSVTSTNSKHSFWWNYHLCQHLEQSVIRWCLRTIYGFIETCQLSFFCQQTTSHSLEDFKLNQVETFHMTLISRRSRKRAGFRFITRGIDRRGDVANFVETEQVVWKSTQESSRCSFSSFVIIRGSVPLFWRQNKGSMKPPPELDASLLWCRNSFRKHFQNLIRSYGSVVALSLVDQTGSEALLAATYARHFELDMDSLCSELRDIQFTRPQLISFDFHRHCSGSDWEEGMKQLLEQVRTFASGQRFFVLHCLEKGTSLRSVQDGVFRVNCVDCLDRTNVAQSAIARYLLVPQAKSVYAAYYPMKHTNRLGPSRLDSASESLINKIWSSNADVLSKQYAGTGALKTDYTRSGKRSTKGLFKDSMNSVMRIYYKNFVDEERQDALDLFLGIAIASASLSCLSSPLWSRYNNVQRLSPGGDKQYVVIELREEAMILIITDGIRYVYPRGSLFSWSKRLSTSGKARLRLWFDEFRFPSFPAVASSLDLHFHKGGPAARERFLRALVTWSDLMIPGYGQRVRVRMLSTPHEAPVSLADWGLDYLEERKSGAHSYGDTCDIEILCLLVPQPGSLARKYGLAAVPMDIESFGYELISAVAAHRVDGPAMAVFMKGNAQAFNIIMEVNEHAYRCSNKPCNGGVGISMEVCGVSLCFVGVHCQGPRDLFDILTHLRVGRPDYDVTNQFPYFYLGGIVKGELHWSRRNSEGDPIWAKMADGASVMTIPSSGTSLLRNSFAGWEYLENLELHDRIPFSMEHSSSSSRLIQPLIDEYIPGKPLPRLSNKIYVCDVWISNLTASNLRLPPGTDPGIPLSFYLTFENDWVEDGVSTKVVQRGSQPSWSEVLTVRMIMTEDVRDLSDQYLLGQVMIDTPLLEDIAAGYFVLPLSSPGNFDVPIRLGGVFAGRLCGILNIQQNLLMENNYPMSHESRIGFDESGEGMTCLDNYPNEKSQHDPYYAPSIKRTNKKKVRKWVGKVTGLFHNRHHSGSGAFDAPQEKGITSNTQWINQQNQPTTSSTQEEEWHTSQDRLANRLIMDSSSSEDETDDSDMPTVEEQPGYENDLIQSMMTTNITDNNMKKNNTEQSDVLIDLEYYPEENNEFNTSHSSVVPSTVDDLLIGEPKSQPFF